MYCMVIIILLAVPFTLLGFIYSEFRTNGNYLLMLIAIILVAIPAFRTKNKYWELKWDYDQLAKECEHARENARKKWREALDE